jgi:hypothetical protein
MGHAPSFDDLTNWVTGSKNGHAPSFPYQLGDTVTKWPCTQFHHPHLSIPNNRIREPRCALVD